MGTGVSKLLASAVYNTAQHGSNRIGKANRRHQFKCVRIAWVKRMGGKRSGRHNKPLYTAEVHKAIVEALKRGAYKEHAANAAGVSRGALDRWLAEGRKGVEPYVQFAEDVDRARAEDALRNQSVISAAAVSKVPGDWKAAAWILERKFPKLYGRRVMVENVDDVLPPAAADDDDDTTVVSPWLVQ